MEIEASESTNGMYTARNYADAAGTYVEVEGVGVCQFDPNAHQEVGGMPGTLAPQEFLPEGDWQFRLPVTGRPIVLLAVGGGNQVFHHWEGDRACRDQGARCELAEPEGHQDGFDPLPNLIGSGGMPDVYVKAVFRFNETPLVPRVHEFDESETGIKRSSARFRPPRK